ncbi:putative RNA-directed DNA polymerase [Helianthus annuus]|nr:putative RNA-directed DNA polymerase [Helianthus annuus]
MDSIDKEENKKLFDFPHWFYNETNEGKPLVTPHVNEDKENQSGDNVHGHKNDAETISYEDLVEASLDTSNINSQDLNDAQTAEHEMQNTAGPPEKNTLVQNEEDAYIRPSRIRTQPARFNEYNVKLPPSIDHTRPTANPSSSTVHPLAHYISSDKFFSTHKDFLSAIESHDEPKTFRQASQDHEWREAMKKEIKALEQNRTWTLEALPKNKRAIDSKWIYKIKYKSNGEVDRYKARLVAKGFTQLEGVDYHDTFAPVAKLVTIRTLLAVVVKINWMIHQLDVNNAFLHEDLEEEVYMKIPEGFAKQGETRVCRLRKSIYGLKQVSRNWYQKFTKALVDLGFRQSKADHSLFIHKSERSYVVASWLETTR